MTTDRAFCRFNPDPEATLTTREIPPDGMCLNAFLLVTSPDRPGAVLLGRPDPAAEWDRIGALDPKRVGLFKDRWILPSSHLLLRESPHEAAARIATEQLEAPHLSFEGPTSAPMVFSEVYPSSRGPELKHHWDLHFVFRAQWPGVAAPKAKPWIELAWKDAQKTPGSEFARAHDDILRLGGLRV